MKSPRSSSPQYLNAVPQGQNPSPPSPQDPPPSSSYPPWVSNVYSFTWNLVFSQFPLKCDEGMFSLLDFVSEKLWTCSKSEIWSGSVKVERLSTVTAESWNKTHSIVLSVGRVCVWNYSIICLFDLRVSRNVVPPFALGEGCPLLGVDQTKAPLWQGLQVSSFMCFP